jgi:hypothetical protein
MASRMMALAVRNTTKAQVSMVAVRASHSVSPQAEQLAKLGNRDIVGFGTNGEPVYQDRVDYPMPAIRFKENTPDVLVSDATKRKKRKKLILISFIPGFARKGEGLLEEAHHPRKESALPCFLLSNIRRNETPNR